MGNAVRKAQLLGAVLAASGAWLSPAAADYEVILATDTDPGTAGQLRYGLENASGTLFFSQTAFPPGTATAIVLAADLVLSADNLVVDGFYSGQGSGDVVIDGDGYRCLAIDGDGNTVRGLTLTGGSVGAEISGSYNRFGEEGFPNQVVDNETSGVLVSGGDDNSIEGNYIGLTSSGAASGNGGDGIRIEGGSGATVGGAGTGRNVVAANGGYGISVNRGGAGAVRTGIRNNYIGTDPTGAAALANGLGGVSVWSAAETVVGGDSAAGEGNLVSGHGSAAGIWFNACTGAGNGVWGNLVGTDASGLLSVPNREGLLLTDSSGIEVGAPGGYLNVFSGNSFCGIRLTQQVASPPATVDNLLRSNLVGLGADGVSAVANGQGRDGDAGIVIEGGAGGNQVGDTGSGEGNLVGENLGDGILLDDSGNNVLRGNLLGTDGAGAALGNLFSGVRLRSGAAGNLLEENTAAFNGQSGERDGVRIEGSGSTSDLVSRNSTYDNAGLGIRLLDGANQGVGPPAIVEVTWTSPSSARVAGTRSLGCGVEVYRADVSGSGPGEGMLYLGSAPLAVSTVWTVETAAGISEGDWLTAVQFTSLSSTSEFCENRLFAPESPTPSPTAVPTASPSPSPTVSPTPSPTISPVPTATPPPTPTPRPAEELYSFPLDTDPGWTVESDWAFGVPAGWGGGTDPINQGYPDPNSGHTGANVYGYNLEGNYPNDMPEYFLTTGPIDCSAATQIKLVFWRWLNVEAATHDYARIEYTTDGEEWVRIYQNLPPPINTTDSAWTVMTYQVQAAGYQPQVRFRWGMGPSDNIRTFSGWNIDDIEIWGVPQATRTPPPTATPTPSATPTSVPTATPPPSAPPTPSPVATPTAAQPVRVYFFSLDYNPSWNADTGWEFGVPQGQGNASGWFNPDPVSGATGANVYGYNLEGDYPGSMSGTSWLTAPALDCSFLESVNLRFQRWLNVERSQYDHALIEFSTDGSRWVGIWENPKMFDVDTADSSWTPFSYQLGPGADGAGTLRLRWGMGPTDQFNDYSGWNIDDIEIWGIPTGPLPGPTPTVITPVPTPSRMPSPVLTPAVSPTPTVEPTPVLGVWINPVAGGDYLGDGRSDIAVFRPPVGLWAVRGATRAYFGASGDLPVSGDYDGDGTADIALYRASRGKWLIRGVTSYFFGRADDRVVPGDYDADGVTDACVFRPSSGSWIVRAVTKLYFGKSGDLPVRADYGGDGGVDVAVFRPSSGLWIVRSLTRVYFGSSSDYPVPARYGEAAAAPAVFRPFAGLWLARGTTRFYFGTLADLPIPADYDGDGFDDPAIYRADSGLWWVRGISKVYHGAFNDLPATR